MTPAPTGEPAAARTRVLHVCDFAAPYPGAFIRQLRMLDEQLQSIGAGRCAFAFPQAAEGSPWLDALREDGFAVHLLPAGSPRTRRHVAEAIAGVVERVRPDIVHSHFGTYDLSLARAVRRLRRGGSPVVQVWHYRTALEEPVHARSPVRRAKDFMKYRLGTRGVSRVFAVTEAMAQEVAARGAGAKAQAVVAGCDTDTFRPDPQARDVVRRRLGIGEEEVLVLHLGWHWHRKGGDLLASAARELAAAGVEGVHFASIGAPADEVEEPVRSLPPTDAVQELHQASDIFVSASRSEGFGNGLVEALACERVAVAALAEGQREVFAGLEGCIAVPVEDAHAIAGAIRSLLQRRSDWPALGADNRARITERHSMRRWARELAARYEEVAPLEELAAPRAPSP